MSGLAVWWPAQEAGGDLGIWASFIGIFAVLKVYGSRMGVHAKPDAAAQWLALSQDLRTRGPAPTSVLQHRQYAFRQHCTHVGFKVAGLLTAEPFAILCTVNGPSATDFPLRAVPLKQSSCPHFLSVHREQS